MQTKKFKNGDRVKVVDTGQFGRIMIYYEKSKKYKVLVSGIKHIYSEDQLTEPVTEKVTNSIHHVFEYIQNLSKNENVKKYGLKVFWLTYLTIFGLLIYKYKV